MEVSLHKTKLPIKKGDFLNDELFQLISSEGFLNTRWDDVPDELLIYIFLHDEPVMGLERTDETKKEYLRDLLQFLQFAKARGGIRQLAPEHLLAYQTWLQNGPKNYKPTTARKKATTVKQFYKYLHLKDIIPTDITYKMKQMAQPKESLVNRDLSSQQVEQLIKHFRKNDLFAYTLFMLLISTGLRIEELVTAKWRDLTYHFELGCYFLTVVGKGRKINGKPNTRPVRIFEDVLESLIELRKRRGLETELSVTDESAFFPTRNGGHYNKKYLSAEFTRLVKETQLPFVKMRTAPITPHTCRHYTASYFAKRGIDLNSIKDLLGHKTLQTTERYLWRHRELEEHAAVKLGERFM